jgi:uncharacterized protein DUF3810
MPRVKLAAVAIALVLAVAPTPAAMIERWYSQGLYAAIQPVLTGISNAAPFALFDVLCTLTIGGLILWWVRRLRAAPRGARLKTAGRLLGDSAAAAAILYLWFLAAWGLNYRREKITTRVDYDEQRITRDAVIALASTAAQSATTTRDLVPADPDSDLIADLTPAFQQTLDTLEARHARPGTPKWSMLSPIWRRVGVDGMIDPFFLESLVRTDLLAFERPFVVLHEWSHLAGFADESEASFVAYLACLRGTARMKYSGWLLMYLQVSSELPRSDRDAVQKLLGPGPAADLRTLAEKTRREIVPVAWRANTAVYDQFLKANRLASGIRSYDEVTRLLVGTKGITP